MSNNIRLGEEKINNQGCLMKIVKYNNSMDIIIEFQDKYKSKIKTQYSHFLSGEIKNPYCKSVFGIGMIGNKYPKSINGKITKEYNTWSGMLRRCFDAKCKNNHQTYQNVIYCDEWLLEEVFLAYKQYKESLIKQVAKIEYDKKKYH